MDVFHYNDSMGTNYRGPANLNSTGKSASISAFGFDVAASNFTDGLMVVFQ